MIPMALRSLREIGEVATGGPALPFSALGATYTMAQEAAWLDADHFAVGRWDGSLSVFSFVSSPTSGPIISKAVNSPSQEGVQMIVPILGAAVFLSSNDEASFVMWGSASGDWKDLIVLNRFAYDRSFGVANSGAVLRIGAQFHLVVGHAQGRVTIWRAAGALDWSLVATTDVRAGSSVNPWGLTNVRGVAPLGGDGRFAYAVVGSEDGNLTVVRVPDGRIVSATCYNPAAKRGINTIASIGNTVLVANCAVGPSDSNLWAFAIDPSDLSLSRTANVNLVVDASAAQVFNFDVVTRVGSAGEKQFLAATGEGAIWIGDVSDAGGLQVVGHESLGPNLGSALCVQDHRFVAAAYDIDQFAFDAIQPRGGATGAGTQP